MKLVLMECVVLAAFSVHAITSKSQAIQIAESYIRSVDIGFLDWGAFDQGVFRL